MAANVAAAAEVSHRVIREKRSRMAKAVLPKGENVEFRSGLRDLGGCLDFARRYVGWNIDQLADALHRDSKQVARWIRGEERTQVDVVLGVRQLHGPFVIALAQLRSDEVVIETTIRIKGMAGYK
jgi:hypothetical protein